MTQTATRQPAQPPPDLVTVADVMRPSLTTADTNDQVAAAAYLMKHARATALTVLDTQTGQPKASSPRPTSPARSRTAKTSTTCGSGS